MRILIKYFVYLNDRRAVECNECVPRSRCGLVLEIRGITRYTVRCSNLLA